jgi:hypothetical protein
MAWVDSLTGWTLSVGSLAGTTDGGLSWTRLQAPCCVSHLRFHDAQFGYAFGPRLFFTTDGGRNWGEMSGPQVGALELQGSQAVRVVTDTTGCPPGCRYAVERTEVGTLGWPRSMSPALEGGAAALARRSAHERA